MSKANMRELSLALSLLAKEKGELESQLASIRAEEATLRDQAQSAMQEQGYKTFEGHGLQLVRSSRKSIKVANEDELRDFIAIQGRQDDYMKFDLVAAKKDAVKNGWPGVEEVVTDVLSIREKPS